MFQIGDLVKIKRSVDCLGIVLKVEKDFYKRPLQDRVKVDWICGSKFPAVVYEPANALEGVQ